MIYDHVGAIKDPLKQDVAPEFCRNEKNVISILTETHINHDKIHHTRNNWLGPIFFSPGDIHAKPMPFLFHLGLEDITEVDTDPKGRFVSFKVTTSNKSSLFVPLQGIAPRKSWPWDIFSKGCKIISKKKRKKEGNGNKIMLADLNCTNKIDRDGENKTQRLFSCCSNYALSKLRVAWGSMEKGQSRFSWVHLLQ